MRFRRTALAILATTSLCSFGQEPQMDMNEIMKWSQAQFIRYHVVGNHDTKASVSSAGIGFADVKDSVTIDFLWDLAQGLVGEAKFVNVATTTTNLRDLEPTCLPPVLKGPFEFYDLQKVEPGISMTLMLTVKTTYPVVAVAQSCTASRRNEPAKVIERPEELPVPSPVGFGMGAANTSELEFHKDKQQIVYRKSGWVWTFTPTPAKKP